MSGIYKRGKVWWLRSDPVTGVRLSTKCTHRKAAEGFLAERERLAADPTYAAAHQATISKWSGELERVKKATRSAGTADMYATKLGHIVRVFGAGAKMASINPGSVDAYIAKRREETAGEHTIAKELIVLSQLCQLAKRGGEYAGDISTLRPVGFSSGYEPRKTVLSAEQVTTLLGKLPVNQAALVALIAATGARRSEAQRIRPADIDMVRWTVRIAGTKTEGSDREIPIQVPAQQGLLRFALGTGALPAKWPSMSSTLPDVCERHGLPRVTPNDLRRSFATWGIEAGISRADVAKLLGHTSTAMVFKVYGQESAEALGEKIRRDLGGTPTSHYGVCFGGPKALSACNSGVSDGDRTRDNRSHSPAKPSPEEPSSRKTAEKEPARVLPGALPYHRVRTETSQLDPLLLTAALASVTRRSAARAGAR